MARGGDTADPAGLESTRERRAPILARYETTLQARHFRSEMQRLGRQLEQLAPRDRRPVYALVRWLASNWIGLHGPSHRTLITEVASSDSKLRVAVFSDPSLRDPEFWSELVSGSPPDLFQAWAHDRRDGSGVWFELARGEH